MTRFGWLVFSGVGVAALGIALLLWGFARQSSPPLTEEDNLTPVVDVTTLNLHANGEYGFSLQYPASASVTDAYPEEGGPAWRTGANHPGTPIVSFSISLGEVRIGVSSDARALASCEKAGPSEVAAGEKTFGNATWQVFTFDVLGTEEERRVTSYRTVHDGQCFALEAFERFGEPTGAPTEAPDFMITSFTFAR